MMVPFKATSIENAIPAETMAAPHAPTLIAMASEAGRSRGGHGGGRHYVLHRGVQNHVQRTDHGDAENQGDGDAAFGTADFSGDHVEVVPTVVGPERCDERSHESGDAALRTFESGSEIGPSAVRKGESDADDGEDHRDFQDGEEQLKLAGFLDADVIERRDENGSGDGDQLSPGDADAELERFVGRKERAGKVPRMRTMPEVTVAMEAGLATMNQVQA